MITKKRVIPPHAPARRSAQPSGSSGGKVPAKVVVLAESGNCSAAIEQLRRHLAKGASADQEPERFEREALRLAQHLEKINPALALQVMGAALAAGDDFPALQRRRGSVLDRIGRHSEARDACEAVVRSSRCTPQDRMGAANLLVRYQRGDLAFEHAEIAYRDMGEPIQHAPTFLYIAQRVAHWPTVERLTAQLKKAHREGETNRFIDNPRTHLLWCADEPTNIAAIRHWNETTFKKPHLRFQGVIEPSVNRKLRIAYLSSDYREHPTARLINGLFRHHDRTRFELFLYCSGWDDGSAMRREVESHMDHVHSVVNMSDEAAASLIRSHGIDVLVELNGPTRANRMGILAHRPAPVQIDYLGWPGSVGGRVVDYIVGDRYTVPDEALPLYPEKVIRLRHTYQVNDYAARPRPVPMSYAEAGLNLQPGELVVGMFNAINKVHEAVWAAWMGILKAVPHAKLWLLNPGQEALRNLSDACRRYGVPVSRVMGAPGLPQDKHLQRLALCDLMLDPWPYGGHTSTSDALYAGVPVITLAGTNFPSRVSAGLLHAAGLSVLVQPDVESYTRLAINLLSHPEELRRIKQHILQHVPGSEVFNAKSRALELEMAYRRALELAAAGQEPRHITIGGPEQQTTRHAAMAPLATTSPPTEKAPSDQAAHTAPPIPTKEASSSIQPAQPTDGPSPKPGLVLICGPWSSGTSAVAGLLGRAGLQAPGPYVKVNDPRTSDTHEMLAFQQVLKSLADERTLKRTVVAPQSLQALVRFRDEVLMPAVDQRPEAPPVMLKHGLAALFLPELCEVFDVRLVGVLRPLADIEATRLRRKWGPSFGEAGARVIYRALFDHIVNATTPYHLVRYQSLMSEPQGELSQLLNFCGYAPEPEALAQALAFVERPKVDTSPAN